MLQCCMLLYNRVLQYLNDILSSLEKYFSACTNIKCIYQNNWVTNTFLINKKREDFFIIEYDKFIEMTTDLSKLYTTKCH